VTTTSRTNPPLSEPDSQRDDTLRGQYSRTMTEIAARRERVARVKRVLVVGSEGFVEHVNGLLNEMGSSAEVHTADGYIMALGEAGANPPDVVIGSGEGLSELGASAAAGFRKLSEHARLIVLPQPTDAQVAAARSALSNGFDVFLTQPVRAIELLDAMCPVDNKTLHHTVQTAIDDAVTPMGGTMEPIDELAADADLGDIDLVEHLLHDRKSIVTMAMSILRASSPLREAQWASDTQDIPADHVAEPVRYESRQFGHLHCPKPMEAADLASWAAWLSRWLALEYKMQQLTDSALTDHLTGAWNRRYFERFLQQIIGRATEERFRVTVMFFDIDNFKHYNDTYGHDAGDEILVQTARLMKAVVRDHDVVARVGGDEFAVIFWDSEGPRRPNSQHPTDVRRAAKRFQQAVQDHKFPKLTREAPGTLTISGGLATFPWDGSTAEELVNKADEMALQSKKQGKNALTFGPGLSQLN